MTQPQWRRVVDTMAKLPSRTRRDLIQKLAWIVDGYPGIFTDDETTQFVNAVREADTP